VKTWSRLFVLRLCPLDNSGALLRELAHMVKPAWVLFGTVAGGSGVYGLMQSGIPVVALARNEEHSAIVRAALRKRLAADLCCRTSPLVAGDLLVRAEKLCPRTLCMFPS